MKKDKDETKVMFFMETGNGTANETPFAYFPETPSYGIYMTSYAHIGQHSSCHPNYVKDKRRAEPHEYADLKEELERIGYNLDILP